ncbi:YciI family protein [Ensifer adhaerens]|uniref:YciI family protein n=1 Tax=Ensifer adhaerens TaxID=106592 RepID=UPI001CBDED45|nr:YciI family protein [Ensifer adhaerens]MBZ7924779.1 YciI family protein [Ensifer adhaerens]UAX95999.1 YciI family protein [Ensifer adhaerens]UAY04660.1 YciI family protein [Ensifer adhaerens]UAY10091.1 YciI family protein [Ensifer adhaerens]
MPSPGDNIFVCISQYMKPLSEVDAHLPAHMEWLQEQDRAGRTIATGRQVSGTGGVNLMAARDRNEMLEILGTDPFQVHGCSSYWIFEFELNPDPAKGRLMDYFFSDAFSAGAP